MCACTISPQDFSRKRYRCTAQKINSLSIRRNGSRGRKSRCPGNDASSEWKLQCGPPQQRHRVSVCKQHDAFSKPHTECGHTLTSKFSIHKMSDQYFITGCFSRSGVKKNRFSACDLYVSPSRCAPADLRSQCRRVVWPTGYCYLRLWFQRHFFRFNSTLGIDYRKLMYYEASFIIIWSCE